MSKAAPKEVTTKFFHTGSAEEPFLLSSGESLPVSMEMKQEHRKLMVAMAIVMDRNGSMGMTVQNGFTKMQLADKGAGNAIEFLGSRHAWHLTQAGDQGETVRGSAFAAARVSGVSEMALEAYARMPFATLQASTPVRRRSRPWWR